MKRILWIFLVQICLLILLFEDGRAAERREFYNSIRCQGMGGACIAVTNDETALLINPAALGRLRDFYGTFFDPEFETGYHTQSMYSASSFSNPFSIDDLKGALDQERGKYYHSKGQVFPSIVGRNFGIGLYGNYILDAQMSDDGTVLDAYYRNDMALVLGFNFKFWGGRAKLGFNTKLISRIEVANNNLDPNGSLALDQIGTEGVGLSTDVGLIIAAPWKWLPTVSAVLRDVGGTSFDKSSGLRLETSDRPNLVQQDLDVAMALFPIHSRYVRSSWTLEYRGLLTAHEEEDKAKLIHAGMEFNIRDLFFMRAGYHQRYWTAGFEIASEYFQWQFATYGEEIGTQASPREDRRYAFKFAYRF